MDKLNQRAIRNFPKTDERQTEKIERLALEVIRPMGSA